MKLVSICLSFFLFVSCTSAKEIKYTGSTPANEAVRSFLGIPLSDSVDFIRWRLTFTESKYQIDCHYGIGKPNTNGFISGGSRVRFEGQLIKEKNYYRLKHEKSTLNILELNSNLLHLLDADNAMLVGGGGWSFALSNEVPGITEEVSVPGQQTVLKDSMAFHGRTPCRGIDNSPGCYKLKWSVVLYADTKTNQPNGCLVNGTAYNHVPANGSWKIITGKGGRITYQVNVKDRVPLYLLKLDENIVTFTDEKGNLLAGDLDFSYALNRK